MARLRVSGRPGYARKAGSGWCREPERSLTIRISIVRPQRLFKVLNEMASVERLGQKTQRPGTERSRARGLIGEGRYEDERHVLTPLAEKHQKFDAAHGRHVDIRHDVSSRQSDRRNASADSKVWTTYESDCKRLPIAARTDASSSMMEIIGSMFIPTGTTEKFWCGRPVYGAPWGGLAKLYLGFYALTVSRDQFRSPRPS